MNILIYRWNSYNQTDIEETFTSLGHSIDIFDETPASIDNDDSFGDSLISVLSQKDYDIVFSINYFPVISQACHAKHTPYVCWTCDSPLLAMYHKSVFNDTNFIFTFDYNNYTDFKAMGVEHIFHLPLASNIEHFNNLFSKRLPYPQYDVSFVGSLYDKNSFDTISTKLPDYLYGYFDGALYAQLQVSGGNLLEKLLTPDICAHLEELIDYRQSDDSFADIQTLFSTTVLGFKAASMARRMYLNSLSKHLKHIPKPLSAQTQTSFNVNIFTDSDTGNLPLVTKHGRIDYRTQMPFIFSDSLINLNITIPNIQTGIPLRAWDIIGCHGFLMTDFRQELLNYFVPDKDIVIFENTEELLDKTTFYLSHDTARTKIANSAYEKVSNSHTYKHRLETIIKTINKYI